jgi:DNA-binding MarR family transcriptional regulator
MGRSKTEILTEISLVIFRINGSLLDAGDRLVEPLKLTSARWQVMGAVALAAKPLTAPQIAAAMGITRQGVQKQVNALVKEGLVTLHPNSGHKRSPFIALSELGAPVYREVDSLWADLANRLATDFSGNDLQVTLRTLEAIRERLVKSRGGKKV